MLAGVIAAPPGVKDQVPFVAVKTEFNVRFPVTDAPPSGYKPLPTPPPLLTTVIGTVCSNERVSVSEQFAVLPEFIAGAQRYSDKVALVVNIRLVVFLAIPPAIKSDPETLDVDEPKVR